MKLVTDGKSWAIKKGGWLLPRYMDLEMPGFWWSRTDKYFRDCWGDLATCQMWLKRLKS